MLKIIRIAAGITVEGDVRDIIAERDRLLAFATQTKAIVESTKEPDE